MFSKHWTNDFEGKARNLHSAEHALLLSTSFDIVPVSNTVGTRNHFILLSKVLLWPLAPLDQRKPLLFYWFPI